MNQKSLTVKLIKSGQPNETIFILGAHGSGKTTLIANLLLEKKRFVIFDTKEDFPAEFFGSDCRYVNDENQFLALLNSGVGKIVVRLYLSPDREKLFDKCCDYLFRWHTFNQKSGVNTWFVLDEFNAFCSSHVCSEKFQDILQRGRSVGIKKIFGAQWFGSIPTWARDGFSEIYTFRHTDSAGLERLATFGFDPDEVSELPQYVCLYSGKNKMERLSLVPDKISKPTK